MQRCDSKPLQRAIKVRLLIDQPELLQATVDAYTRTFNRTCQAVWEEKMSLGKVHGNLYYELREQEPQLPSQLVISALAKAKESVKSARTWQRKVNKKEAQERCKAAKRSKPYLKKHKRVRCPRSKYQTVRYDQRNHWVRLDLATKMGEVSLSTVQGRIKGVVVLNNHALRALKDGWQLSTSSTLVFCQRKKRWQLVLIFNKPDSRSWPLRDVVGIDLGQNNLAVTSRGQFFNSKQRMRRSERYRKLTNQLSEKGTRSAKLHLRRIKGRWRRFQADVNHCVSKQIIASLNEGDAIALEDLTNIRERTNRRKEDRTEYANWAFCQLRSFLTYKAHQSGHSVCLVDPAYTSQTCPKCNHRSKNNRRNQSTFKCRRCNFQLHADLVGARNIRQRAMTSPEMPSWLRGDDGLLAKAAIIQPKGLVPDVAAPSNRCIAA